MPKAEYSRARVNGSNQYKHRTAVAKALGHALGKDTVVDHNSLPEQLRVRCLASQFHSETTASRLQCVLQRKWLNEHLTVIRLMHLQTPCSFLELLMRLVAVFLFKYRLPKEYLGG